jgi:tight adherence protein B
MVGIISAALCGAAALPLVLDQGSQLFHRSRLQARIVGTTADKDSFMAGVLRRGIVLFRPISRLLLHLRWFRVHCECCAHALRIAGRETDTSAMCEVLLGAFGLLVAVLLVLTGTPLVAFCLAAMAVGLAFGKAHRVLGQWEERLIDQIPDALRSLGICFNAGYSLQQAFEQTACDTPEPLGTELRQANFDVCAGKSIEEALGALEKRTRATDLRFAIVALEIQHRTGGSLQDLLEDAADAVLASADLRRQLAVQTAQARLSAKVVTVLPLLLVAALSVAMDGYLQTFFSSAAGLFILVLALGMEAIGVLLIRKILGVDLG